MTVTELLNGRIQKRREPEELRYIFFGDVVKKSFNYCEYFDFTGIVVKMTAAEFEAIKAKSPDVPVRITDCRFVYRDRFFKTSIDTTDSDLVLGAIVEKDRRKAAREKKLREVGRKARAENPEDDSPEGALEWWKTLGVSRNATREQITRAYLDLMTGCHPDKVAHLSQKLKEVAEAEAKKLNAAREAALQECDRP